MPPCEPEPNAEPDRVLGLVSYRWDDLSAERSNTGRPKIGWPVRGDWHPEAIRLPATINSMNPQFNFRI